MAAVVGSDVVRTGGDGDQVVGNCRLSKVTRSIAIQIIVGASRDVVVVAANGIHHEVERVGIIEGKLQRIPCLECDHIGAGSIVNMRDRWKLRRAIARTAVTKCPIMGGQSELTGGVDRGEGDRRTHTGREGDVTQNVAVEQKSLGKDRAGHQQGQEQQKKYFFHSI